MRNGTGYKLYRKLKPLMLISREEWGALPPKLVPGDKELTLDNIEHPVPRVIISYSEEPMCNDIEECKQNLKNIQRTHMEEGYMDIKYNFLVGGDGNVYEGRGWPFKPAVHAWWPEWHGGSYEISHMGFHGINLPMYMAKAAWDTIEVGISNKYVIPEGPIFPDLWKAYHQGLVGPCYGEPMEGGEKETDSKMFDFENYNDDDDEEESAKEEKQTKKRRKRKEEEGAEEGGKSDDDSDYW